MSFECRYFTHNHCDLIKKECRPGQKGCVLNQAGAYFIGQDEDKKENKDQDGVVISG